MSIRGKIQNFVLPLRPLRSPRRSAPAEHGLCGEHSRGFTLIELLIVMVVIAILVGITIPVSKYVSLRARKANQQIYLEKIKNALEDYRAAYGEYPITPTNSGGVVLNLEDVRRHYPDRYATECYYTTNSPCTNVDLATNSVECIETSSGKTYIDYCLTYPLMLMHSDRRDGHAPPLSPAARPFMDFKKVTVAFLVYKPKETAGVDVFEIKRKRKLFGGVVDEVTKQYITGNPVNRYKAIDPVSQKQWKYSSWDGVTYILTNNSF